MYDYPKAHKKARLFSVIRSWLQIIFIRGIHKIRFRKVFQRRVSAVCVALNHPHTSQDLCSSRYLSGTRARDSWQQFLLVSKSLCKFQARQRKCLPSWYRPSFSQNLAYRCWRVLGYNKIFQEDYGSIPWRSTICGLYRGFLPREKRSRSVIPLFFI
jgi:hypothetical protein